MQPRINEFLKTFGESIKEGDVFELLYLTRSAVVISKSVKKAKTLQALDFKEALFGIWRGQQPTQKSIDQNMLGQR